MRDSEAAWHEALYGRSGFFTGGALPADHFRTAPHVGPELAEALLELLSRVDSALGCPARVDFVDVGAGGGELSAAVRSLATGSLADRLVVTAVDLAPPRPLPGVRWRTTLPPSVTGLLVGHEWLDAVPCPVVEWPCADPWLTRWWPLRPGWRAEVGAPRDRAWARAVGRVTRGAALAVDYGHVLADRAAGRYREGTFAAYRGGRRVEPVFDGSCDLTAHVALDACAAAAGGDRVLVAQRDALKALGLTESGPGGGANAGWAASTTSVAASVAASASMAASMAVSRSLRPRPVGGPNSEPGTGAPAPGVSDSRPGTGAPEPDHPTPGVSGSGSGAGAPWSRSGALSAGTGSGAAAWLAAAERASRVAELRAVGGLGSFGWLLHGVGIPVSALLPPLAPWTGSSVS
ncbi:SAM-dependent methyltransferase [Actinosynnema sp. NPDC020468]|uniref:SAM-dependent methyltransferase n=1 Tax=Actinosynnema sp. NPDC020468 TaxID=3154488 RepID=UPI0034118A88